MGFAIQFGSGELYQGIEFYPGEAMLVALLDDALDFVSLCHRQDMAAAPLCSTRTITVKGT